MVIMESVHDISQIGIGYFRDIDRFTEIYYPGQDSESVLKLIEKSPGIDFRYFCFRYLDEIRKFELPKLEQDLSKEAVIVEFRSLPHLEFVLRNAIRKLGDNWSFTVVCGNHNYDFMSAMVRSMGVDIKLIRYDLDNIDQNSYSSLLSEKSFWDRLIGEKILIFQEDSCIFKCNIDDFMEWDYVGAPWALQQNTNKLLVGNGGLSLRTKSVMLKTISRIGIKNTSYNSSTVEFMRKRELTVPPEDVYFSKNIID